MNLYPTALGICGWKNSGKTTLVEQLIPKLQGMGLHIAVVKSDAHGIDVDHQGKDSDRFYKAGADVVL
ncbi:MAG: molybdopterin-guanine dinucleotide biosynthesis protein MobB, partial [Planctomycetota bacterium]